MKPVLRKSGGLWQCRGSGREGWGFNPRQAFHAWTVATVRNPWGTKGGCYPLDWMKLQPKAGLFPDDLYPIRDVLNKKAGHEPIPTFLTC